MGYRVNASAKAMRYGRFNALSLLMSEDHPQFRVFERIWDGMQGAMQEHNLQLNVHRASQQDMGSPDAAAGSTASPKVFREAMADGFIVYMGVSPQSNQWLQRLGLPAMWINQKLKTDSVYVADLDCARDATRRLIDLGHRKVAYVDYVGTLAAADDPVAGHYSGADRWAGYREAMVVAGLTPVRFGGELTLEPPERLAAAEAMLAGPDRPTAVLTYSAASATPVLFAATARLRLDVPGDLSLITFDHAPLCDTGLPVATIVLPEREMGQRAVEMLVEKIKTPSLAPLPSVELGCDFTPGSTLAPPADAD